MLARGDSQAIQSFPAASPPPFPAWARAVNAPETEAETAFLAGAALARLDAIVRQNPPWAGVFRRRLALSAAAASARRAGRTEDEAALRDAFHLTRPGADPGPAGQRLLAWRELSARSAGQWRQSFEVAAEVLGVPLVGGHGRAGSFQVVITTIANGQPKRYPAWTRRRRIPTPARPSGLDGPSGHSARTAAHDVEWAKGKAINGLS